MVYSQRRFDEDIGVRYWRGGRAWLCLLASTMTVVLAASAPASSAQSNAAPSESQPRKQQAQSRPAALQVDLQGVLPGGKAVLSINGGTSRMVASGQLLDGIKLIAVDSDSATIEIDGKRERITMGSAPYRAPVINASAQPAGNTGKAVLSADSRGHFVTTGFVNGKPQQFLVDTGASIVAISSADAKRLGVIMTNARTVQANTANGVTYGLAVKLDSLRVGDIMAYNVEAWVLDNLDGPALLGNTFLNRVSMTRDAGTLVLKKNF